MNFPHNEPLCAALNREAENHRSASLSLVTDFSSWPTVGKKCAVPIKREFLFKHTYTLWVWWKRHCCCWDSVWNKKYQLLFLSSGSGFLPPRILLEAFHGILLLSQRPLACRSPWPERGDFNSSWRPYFASPACLYSPSSFHFPLYGRHSNRRQARQRRHCGLFLCLPNSVFASRCCQI